MRKTIRLTESEFRTMVEETINEALQDEGLWNNIKAGAKNAFGSDVSRIGQAARGATNSIKRGVQNMGSKIQQTANNVQQGIQKRADAWKAGAQANANNEKLNDIVNKLQDLQSSGVLHGAKTDQAIKTLIYQIGMLTRGNNSTASAYRNRI